LSEDESQLPPGNPWWIPRFFLGSVPAIEPRHVTLLGFVALAMLFENYDFQILNAALPFIASDLEIAHGSLGYFTGAIRFGGVVGFFLIPFADWIGRRRLFMISVAGLSLGTCATAFSQTPLQFVLCQIFSRAFMASGAAVTYVIVAEEFPARHRGWGVGMLGAVGSVGHGLGAGIFAAINELPFGWRALYSLGVVPLLLLPMFRRKISETRRFVAHEADLRPAKGARAALGAWLRPLRKLAQSYPLRTIGITLMGLLASVSHSAVFVFISLFVIEFHGWQPWQYTLMFILCGALGIVGNVVAGRLGDAIGRRPVAFVFLASFPCFAWLFYAGPAWVVPFVWILLVFAVMAGNVTMRALTTELFPTSYRGTATGWLFLMEAMGGAIGGTLVSVLTPGEHFSPWAVIAVSFAAVGGAFAVLLFPETHQRELETISSE
jgi:MFS family permease